jgi:hypothetical protein
LLEENFWKKKTTTNFEKKKLPQLKGKMGRKKTTPKHCFAFIYCKIDKGNFGIIKSIHQKLESFLYLV